MAPAPAADGNLFHGFDLGVVGPAAAVGVFTSCCLVGLTTDAAVAAAAGAGDVVTIESAFRLFAFCGETGAGAGNTFQPFFTVAVVTGEVVLAVAVVGVIGLAAAADAVNDGVIGFCGAAAAMGVGVCGCCCIGAGAGIVGGGGGSLPHVLGGGFGMVEAVAVRNDESAGAGALAVATSAGVVFGRAEDPPPPPVLIALKRRGTPSREKSSSGSTVFGLEFVAVVISSSSSPAAVLLFSLFSSASSSDPAAAVGFGAGFGAV